jgi:PiT family inorganic phosphate transporter
MGIIALAIFTASRNGAFDHAPPILESLQLKSFSIPIWVKVVCAITMAAGTAAGGRRIIRTLGRKVARLHPPNGFAADITSAAVLMMTARLGMPVSTTHVVSASIMGVGTARSSSAMRWDLVESILWAWVLTLPTAGLLGYSLMSILVKTGLAAYPAG